MKRHVSFERRGRTALITLDRPAALNALSLDMIRAFGTYLEEAERDDDIGSVVVRAEGDRAFCAGGDLRALVEWGRDGRTELFQFYREEYALNARIARFPKPYVSLLHGVVMGGGAGISVNGSHRVVSERVIFAMPEVAVGFVPDVGASHFLSRMPGRTGRYLAATAERIGAKDMVWAGLATHHVPQARFGELVERLAEKDEADAILADMAEPVRFCDLEALRPQVERLFAADEAETVLAALDAEDGPHAEWAAATAAAIRRQAPTSVKLALELQRRGEDASLEECLLAEFRVVSRLVQRTDFYEGVRATLIDKSAAARWQPASLDAVSRADIDAFFVPSPLAEPDLG